MLCFTLVNCYWACELHDEYLFMKIFEIMHSQDWQHFEPYIEQVMQSKDPYIEHTSYLYIMTKPSLDFNAYSYQLQQIMSITLHNTFFCKDPVWNESDYCRNAWYSKKDKMCKFDPKMHQTLGGGFIVKFEKSLLWTSSKWVSMYWKSWNGNQILSVNSRWCYKL